MSEPAASLKGFLIRGLPVIKEGDDIPALLRSLFDLQDGDVLCLASTIVAKAEGRVRDLSEYQPDSHAVEIARELGKDPRFVQAVFNESSDVLIERPFLLVATLIPVAVPSGQALPVWQWAGQGLLLCETGVARSTYMDAPLISPRRRLWTRLLLLQTC